MGRGGPRASADDRRRRVVPASIRSVDRGRRAADVRRRGASAHSGRRDGRSLDPRQAVPRRLGAPPRRVRFALRQRVDMGTDADRAHRAHRHARCARSEGVVRADRRARRRARRARRASPGDEDDGRAIRHGANDRRGARAKPAGIERATALFVRHARGSGAHDGRREALFRRLFECNRHDRAERHRPRRADLRAAVDLNQALRAASALRIRAFSPSCCP